MVYWDKSILETTLTAAPEPWAFRALLAIADGWPPDPSRLAALSAIRHTTRLWPLDVCHLDIDSELPVRDFLEPVVGAPSWTLVRSINLYSSENIEGIATLPASWFEHIRALGLGSSAGTAAQPIIEFLSRAFPSGLQRLRLQVGGFPLREVDRLVTFLVDSGILHPCRALEVIGGSAPLIRLFREHPLPNLRHLAWMDPYGFDCDDWATELVGVFRRLSSIHLSQFDFDDATLLRTLDNIAHAPMQRVTLDRCNVTEDVIGRVRQVGSCSTLTMLRLPNNPLEDTGAMRLLADLQAPELVELDLENCGITAASIGALGGLVRKADFSLNVALNNIGDAGVDRLLDILPVGTLRRLNLGRVGCTPSAIRRFCEARQTPQLKSLNISGCPFGDDERVLLCTSLLSPSLEQLDIYDCGLTDESLYMLLSRKPWHFLRGLGIGQNRIAGPGLRGLRSASLPFLHDLDLAYNPLADVALDMLTASDVRTLLRLVLVPTDFTSREQFTPGASRRLAESKLSANLESVEIEPLEPWTEVRSLRAIAQSRIRDGQARLAQS